MSSSPSTSELFTAIADASKLDVLARMQVMGVVEDEHLQLTTKLGYSCSSPGSSHRLDCN